MSGKKASQMNTGGHLCSYCKQILDVVYLNGFITKSPGASRLQSVSARYVWSLFLMGTITMYLKKRENQVKAVENIKIIRLVVRRI